MTPITPPMVSPSRGRHIRIVPERGWAGIDLRELWAFRDLLYLLLMRDVRLRYKQTVLGITWVILQPLVAALIFAVIFGRFAGLPSDGTPYLLFVYTALLPWNLFAGSLGRAGNSLVGDARLISKVYFPRILIPLASSSAVLVDFAVGLIVMFGLLAFYGWTLTLNLLALPFFIALALLVSVGISLFFSALNVYYRDFMFALPFIVQVWLYASPVVYAADIIPEAIKPIYALNPMVGVIDGFRWAMLGTSEFPAVTVGVSLVIGIALFIGGTLIFQRVERNFADVV